MIAACAAAGLSAENKAYCTDQLGEVNGVSDNGRYACISDIDNNIAYLWSLENPDVFVNITPENHSDLPLAEQWAGAQAFDISDDGKTLVGLIMLGNLNTVPAVYENGNWELLPMPATAMNTNGAIAITPDGNIIGGYCFMLDPTSGIGGRYYPVQWIRNNDEWELKTFDIELPDHQGFFPLAMSRDGRVIAGTVYCGKGSNIECLLVDGEFKIFHDVTEVSEPWEYRGKWYCGVDENGKQIWTDDPNDPRIVLFTEYYIDGIHDDADANSFSG